MNAEIVSCLALKNYDSFVGVDISDKDVESARKRLAGKPVRMLQMNAEALEFGDGSFDTVSISDSLHHLDKIDNVLAEMRRVLKTGGHFILQEMYCDGDQTEAQKTEILKHHWHAEIDSLLGMKEAVSTVQASGMPRYQRQNVGHSIGLQVMEPPVLTPENDTELQENMIIAIEMPYYEIGFGAFNPEDMIRVTRNGSERLTRMENRLYIL